LCDRESALEQFIFQALCTNPPLTSMPPLISTPYQNIYTDKLLGILIQICHYCHCWKIKLQKLYLLT